MCNDTQGVFRMLQPNKIYVGNIAYSVTEADLNDIFSKFGPLEEVCVIRESETGRSKGFAFIRFETAEQAQDALCLNGTKMKGRMIVVNIAHTQVNSRLCDMRLRAEYKNMGIHI